MASCSSRLLPLPVPGSLLSVAVLFRGKTTVEKKKKSLAKKKKKRGEKKVNSRGHGHTAVIVG